MLNKWTLNVPVWSMKWKNAVRDHLPEASCQLLVSIRGVYHIALFDKDTKEFYIDNNGTKITLTASDDQVYWQMIPMEKSVKTKKVLIADDDADDHVIMTAAFETSKYKIEVDSVYDGEQVMEYLLRKNAYQGINSQPDLILLDLNMPRMDGFEVLEQMHRYQDLKSIPVYVITTSRDVDHLERAMSLGARGFYSKGASIKYASRVIQEICLECFAELAKQDENSDRN